MTTTLRAPGSKRLKLRFDELPLNFALYFNLRRYLWGAPRHPRTVSTWRGRTVQVDSIKPRVESAYGFSASN